MNTLKEERKDTIAETPPSNKGLLPSLSITKTATPVIINYNNRSEVSENKIKDERETRNYSYQNIITKVKPIHTGIEEKGWRA